MSPRAMLSFSGPPRGYDALHFTREGLPSSMSARLVASFDSSADERLKNDTLSWSIAAEMTCREALKRLAKLAGPWRLDHNPDLNMLSLLSVDLVNPASVAERTRAYNALWPALAAADILVDGRLSTVDWPSRPIIADWAKDLRDAGLPDRKMFDPHFRARFEIAMSGHWSRLREARMSAALAPWLTGALEVRKPAMFIALHAGLPDDLSYLALSVAGDRYEAILFDSVDPILSGLLERARDEKLVRCAIDTYHRSSQVVCRGPKLAAGLAAGEALLTL
jgi:hypothetical protein